MNNKQSFTIFRWAWCSESGSPDNEKKFQTLLPYFPLPGLSELEGKNRIK